MMDLFLGEFFMFSFLILGIIGLALLVFWIWMMISAIGNDNITGKERWFWFFLMLGLGFFTVVGGLLVALVYYFTERRKMKKFKH